jgi:hypothetical protein
VDKDNRHNDLSNLWVFASSADHMSFHRGGDAQPIWRGNALSQATPSINNLTGGTAKINTI